MANLIRPDRNRHMYVIGIDFGHGETSAAICTLQWDTPEGQSIIDAEDIRINPSNTGNEKVIVSAISRKDGSDTVLIGDNAFAPENMTEATSTRVCFKERPQPLTEENQGIYNNQEDLMIEYMKVIYQTIRSIVGNHLTDDNHLVYLARPSGWDEPTVKERYCEMAIAAGIPLAGLTSESRAAIFYAINTPQIDLARNIQNGVIVFDLGSSTLDMTYLKVGEQPVDFGYEIGASIIDKVIFDEKFFANEGVRSLLSAHPKYEAKLLFKARKIKESAYNREAGLTIDESFLLRTQISKDCEGYEKLKSVLIEVEYADIDSLNKSIEEKAEYITRLRKHLIDFRENHIGDKELKGVFLTGGASRMDFVRNIITDAYGLSPEVVCTDPDNPSLTISRGIAMLGRADCMTNESIGTISHDIENRISGTYDRLIGKIKEIIVSRTWDAIAIELDKFADSKQWLCLNELNRHIENKLLSYLQNGMNSMFQDALDRVVREECEEIGEELSDIINIYSPGGRLISVQNTDIQIDITGLRNQIDDLIAAIQRNTNFQPMFTMILTSVALAVATITIVIVAAALFFGRDWVEEQVRKVPLPPFIRRRCRTRIIEGKQGIMDQISLASSSFLNGNTELENIIKPEIRGLLTGYINTNIDYYKIPLE